MSAGTDNATSVPVAVIAYAIVATPSSDEKTDTLLWLYGGSDTQGLSLNQLWKFSVNQGKWTEVIAKGELPPALSNLSMVYNSR